MVKCKNCGSLCNSNYCSECGQPTDTEKLNFHFIWHDIQHGLFHFDKGIFYTFRQLFTRPGHSIREFIEGKRVKHFKPISLVILLAVTYGLLYHGFHIDNVKPFIIDQDANIDYAAYNEWIATHFSWITLMSIPLYTFGTYICFRKQGYNFIEYFILNTFKASQRLFVHIATLPLILLCDETASIRKILAAFYLTDILMGFITNIQFFDRLPVLKTIGLSIVSHLVFLCCVLILGMIVMQVMIKS